MYEIIYETLELKMGHKYRTCIILQEGINAYKQETLAQKKENENLRAQFNEVGDLLQNVMSQASLMKRQVESLVARSGSPVGGVSALPNVPERGGLWSPLA